MKQYPEELVTDCNPVESYVVGLFWKNPDLYLDYKDDSKINKNTFYNDCWWFYFILGKYLRINEGKTKFDDIAVDMALEKLDNKWRKQYEEYGGFEIIEELLSEVEIENFDAYYQDLKKLETLRKLHDKGFNVIEKMDKFKQMSLQQLCDYWEYQLNEILVNVDLGVKSYNLCENLDERIKKANEKPDVGLPLYNMPILNSLFQGSSTGHLYELGMLSGEGKSSFACASLVMSALEYKEKIGIIVNEEGLAHWQNLILTTVLKYKFNYNFNRQRWLQGKFTDEEYEMLQKAKNYLDYAREEQLITFIPLTTYDMDLAKKLIKKHKLLNISIYIIDTFKAETGVENSWKHFMDQAQDLFDICKSEENGGLGIHLFVTTQISKGSIGKRYLSKEDMGGSKGIVDVASVVIIARKIREDERSYGKYPLEVWNYNQYGQKEKIKLDDNKYYYIFWVGKNRRGMDDPYQLVVECDLSCNYWKEIGITKIPQLD